MTGDPVLAIIYDMARPVERAHAKARPGVDLKPHARALRKVLDDIWEEHNLAERDWSLRGSEGKPRREWTRNKKAAASRYDYSAYVRPDHEERFLREWAAHYESTYARPPGNPSVSHDNNLPLAPLAAVYVLLRQWWQARDLGWAWRPELGAKMNPSLRMLYLVARSCGPDYSVANCLAVHDHLRSPARVANKAAKGRVARKKAAKPRARQKTG